MQGKQRLSSTKSFLLSLDKVNNQCKDQRKQEPHKKRHSRDTVSRQDIKSPLQGSNKSIYD